VYRVLVGKYEGKKPLGRPRRRWEDNIKMDLQEVGILQDSFLYYLFVYAYKDISHLHSIA
jgi:hypothetical protein